MYGWAIQIMFLFSLSWQSCGAWVLKQVENKEVPTSLGKDTLVPSQGNKQPSESVLNPFNRSMATRLRECTFCKPNNQCQHFALESQPPKEPIKDGLTPINTPLSANQSTGVSLERPQFYRWCQPICVPEGLPTPELQILYKISPSCTAMTQLVLPSLPVVKNQFSSARWFQILSCISLLGLP